MSSSSHFGLSSARSSTYTAAFFAPSPAVLSVSDVVWRVFMSVGAVRFCLNRLSIRSKPLWDGEGFSMFPRASLNNALLKRHPGSGSPYQAARFDPMLLSKFRRMVLNAIDDHNHIVAPVPLLIRQRKPPAVPWLVIPVWVDTVKRVFRAGLRPHIFKKGMETIPSLTHLDAPAPVSHPVTNIRVVASSSHVAPSAIERVGGVLSWHRNLQLGASYA